MEVIKCANLDNLRDQLRRYGAITLDGTNLPSDAKLAIANHLGSIELTDTPLVEVPLVLPETGDFVHQRFIAEARIEAAKSICWVSKCGAIVVDECENIVMRDHNQPVIPGRHCEGLNIDIKTVMAMLKQGERLDFCQTRHDVESIIAQAACYGSAIGGKRWYLSLEPCDRCANGLVGVKPEAVYFSTGVGREMYYNSDGLRRLVAAGVPTFFVKMPEDE